MKNKYLVIGLMSGTSLDGVDIACCEFNFSDHWEFRIIHAETVSYNDSWKKKLENIFTGDAAGISELESHFGNYLGELVKDFCERFKIVPDFVSSHGHTVFHQPEKGFTRQIGSGAHIAATTGLTVICDFRSKDVALGGQGAPLVPAGDKFLFGAFTYCLNLGGISNISFDANGKRIAFDVSPCNLVLNHYAKMKGKLFDEDGALAASGKISSSLLEDLNRISFYKKSYPKSLGREDIENSFMPLIEGSSLSPEDILATFCEHIAHQLSVVLAQSESGDSMLITGGGTFNTYLLKCIERKCRIKIIIPEKTIIEFKEALIFAFLGVLRMRGENNCLSSVTGAVKDSCSGAVYV